MSGLDDLIAECARVASLPTAPQLELRATELRECEADTREAALDIADAMINMLDEMVDEMKAPAGKPCDTACWKRHARCAINRVRDLAEDYVRPVDW